MDTNRQSPLRELAKVVGLVNGSVIGVRLFDEGVAYTGPYLAFIPGDVFLGIATALATKALGDDPQANFFLSSNGKRLLWALGITVGATIHLTEANAGKRDMELAWAPSQVTHSLVSFGAGARFVGGAILPMLGCRRSPEKFLALAFLAAYVGCFAYDALNPPDDRTMADRQVGIIFDRRK